MFSIKALLRVAILSGVASLAHAQVVGIGTNEPGTFGYSVGAAIAGVMQQNAKLTTRIKPMSGSSGYAPLVNRGEIEFGLLSSLDAVNAYLGVENFKDHKNPDLRLIGVMFPLRVGIVVPNDSPVKTLKDLKGLRMPSQFTAQNTVQLTQDAMLATSGLATVDMKAFPVASTVKGMQALGEGKVDAAQSCYGCAAALELNNALAAHGGMRFLSLPDTPEAMAALRKVFSSAYTQIFQPSPTSTGIVGPTRLMVFSDFLLSSTHVSDDVVYKTTKAIYENKAALAASAAPMKTFDPSVMAEESIVPYHPGAEKFYREVGQWPPKKR